ncbi:FkbM family methyltransferase [Nitratireductor basaltis]|uniref:Methyltransferase FkbM domain-containing protein n=1 Tax=Nitratireductor basaltis TaxID=472175 RepID=A0A084UDI6_9HYPH|nr:FkbM family methyltransferase [Nitratireductor basaltis]KFB11022.1 hypothetical protein EL18_02064 [Nitratireductor basaltis]
MWAPDYGALFANCSATFDPKKVVQRHAANDIKPDQRYVTNFLGVRIDPKFFPGILDGQEGQVHPIPIPANWHADLAEWAAVLRAVDTARESFRAVELGCGWGCWLNCTGVAAKRSGLSVELIGVEGDSGHVQFAKEALEANGFAPSEYRIVHGIAASKHGKALFPNAGRSGYDWGASPIFSAGWRRAMNAASGKSHHTLETITVADLTAGSPIDLLHIDIQGGELDLVRGSLSDINRHVRRMVIGTHSREIEGVLIDLLSPAEWTLEIERPAIYRLSDEGAPELMVDGVQGWANRRL